MMPRVLLIIAFSKTNYSVLRRGGGVCREEIRSFPHSTRQACRSPCEKTALTRDTGMQAQEGPQRAVDGDAWTVPGTFPEGGPRTTEKPFGRGESGGIFRTR